MKPREQAKGGGRTTSQHAWPVRRLTTALRVAGLGVVIAGSVGAGWAAAPVYTEDFSKAEPGKLPSTLMVLDGQFSVKEDAAGRYLELPGAPLESYAAMFGPANKENWSAQARFSASSQGRRFPVFGVSINGVGGYRAQVAPAKKELELLKGDETVARAPFVWENGSWTQVRVQVRKTGEGAWKVEGKAWKDGTAEPEAWTISWSETEEPVAGRAAVWGKPFSGTPIRFDDFKVMTVEKGP